MITRAQAEVLEGLDCGKRLHREGSYWFLGNQRRKDETINYLIRNGLIVEYRNGFTATDIGRTLLAQYRDREAK